MIDSSSLHDGGETIGELLQSAGLISEAQLSESLDEQERSGNRLGEILVTRGLISELQLTQLLSNQLSVAWVSLRARRVLAGAAQLGAARARRAAHAHPSALSSRREAPKDLVRGDG